MWIWVVRVIERSILSARVDPLSHGSERGFNIEASSSISRYAWQIFMLRDILIDLAVWSWPDRRKLSLFVLVKVDIRRRIHGASCRRRGRDGIPRTRHEETAAHLSGRPQNDWPDCIHRVGRFPETDCRCHPEYRADYRSAG